ncbi:MAG: peptide deformylase [Bacteroidota bacterium]|nr:peptide deformylase [Bacteroidota bacterium]
MILPIYAYGCPVLRKKGEDISPDYPNLKEIIDNMYETMYNSSGIGLAAPQVGIPIRLFIIDGSPIEDINPPGFKQTFINPQIIKEWGEEWKYEEGCLSIPTIRENVSRKPELTIRFLDENFVEHEKTYDGMAARIIQHEYDHIEGKLFVDHISPLKRNLIKSKLNNISLGKVNHDYKMKFVKK